MLKSRAGMQIENPVTGERAIVRVGAEDSDGAYLVADLFVAPGGAVAGEHIHPNHEEHFTVISGEVGMLLDGETSIAQPGETVHVMPMVKHDWWNAGDTEARVIVEIRPAEGFGEMIANLFGLARDGKTNSKGMPGLLQLAVFGLEFADVLQFTSPPPLVQKALFTVLAPIARLRGLKGSYPRYLEYDWPMVEVPPLPEGIELAFGEAS